MPSCCGFTREKRTGASSSRNGMKEKVKAALTKVTSALGSKDKKSERTTVSPAFDEQTAATKAQNEYVEAPPLVGLPYKAKKEDKKSPLSLITHAVNPSQFGSHKAKGLGKTKAVSKHHHAPPMIVPHTPHGGSGRGHSDSDEGSHHSSSSSASSSSSDTCHSHHSRHSSRSSHSRRSSGGDLGDINGTPAVNTGGGDFFPGGYSGDLPSGGDHTAPAPAPGTDAPTGAPEAGMNVFAPAADAPEWRTDVPAPTPDAPEWRMDAPAPVADAPEWRSEVPAPTADAPEWQPDAPAPIADAPPQAPADNFDAPDMFQGGGSPAWDQPVGGQDGGEGGLPNGDNGGFPANEDNSNWA